jgi:hypothetical protein
VFQGYGQAFPEGGCSYLKKIYLIPKGPKVTPKAVILLLS